MWLSSLYRLVLSPFDRIILPALFGSGSVFCRTTSGGRRRVVRQELSHNISKHLVARACSWVWHRFAREANRPSGAMGYRKQLLFLHFSSKTGTKCSLQGHGSPLLILEICRAIVGTAIKPPENKLVVVATITGRTGSQKHFPKVHVPITKTRTPPIGTSCHKHLLPRNREQM